MQSPTPSPSDVAGIAEQFVRARLHAHARCPSIRAPCPPNLETAYRCQELAIARWPDADRRLEGRAHCSRAQQDQYAEERLIGPVFAPQRSRGRARAHGRLPGVRRRLRRGRSGARDLRRPRRAAGQGRVDARRSGRTSSASCASASRSRAARSRRSTISAPGAVISDFGNNWGVVVGPAVQRLARAARSHRADVTSTTSSSAAASRRCATARSARSRSRWPSAPDAGARCAPAP